MATVLVPDLMPRALPTRDSSIRQPLQIGQPVTAGSLRDAEAAIAHLAAGRPLAWPPSHHPLTLTTSAQTLRMRGAAPIVPLYAWAYGLLTASDEDTVDITVASTTDPSGTTIEVPVHASVPSVAIRWGARVTIGTGAVEAANLNYEDITVAINKNDAAVTVTLLCAGVSPLPVGWPSGGGTVTT